LNPGGTFRTFIVNHKPSALAGEDQERPDYREWPGRPTQQDMVAALVGQAAAELKVPVSELNPSVLFETAITILVIQKGQKR
jgi:hypothetical protein